MANKHGSPNVLLTRLSLAVRNNMSGMIADFGSPSIKVNKTTGEYRTWPKGSFLKNESNEKADGGVSREIKIKGETATFKTTQYGTRAFYTQRELDDFEDAQGLREANMVAVTQADVIAHEQRVATLLTTAGSYASANKKTLAGSNQWSDPTSTPFQDVIIGKQAVSKDDAVDANAMIMSRLNFDQLKTHPDILSRLQGANLMSGLDDVTPEMVGTLFGLNLKVSTAQKQSSADGQTFTSDYTWGDFALIFHRTATAGKLIQNLAYTFTKQEFEFRTYFDEPSKRFWVDDDHDVVSILVAASVGYLITDVIA